MADIFVIAAIVIALAFGWAARDLYAHWQDMQRRIHELEEAQAKHLPYATADEIENGIAALLKLKFELDVRQDYVENALNHLQKARNPKKK